MNTLKATVYSKLNEITSAKVQQSTQEIGSQLPVVVFRVSQNAPNYDFNKSISLQDVEITVDIFADSSTVASSLLATVEGKMREIDLFLSYTADIPDPDGIFHINTRFTGNIN